MDRKPRPKIPVVTAPPMMRPVLPLDSEAAFFLAFFLSPAGLALEALDFLAVPDPFFSGPPNITVFSPPAL